MNLWDKTIEIIEETMANQDNSEQVEIAMEKYYSDPMSAYAPSECADSIRKKIEEKIVPQNAIDMGFFYK